MRQKGSRFLAVVEAAPEPAAARQVLEELRRLYPDATHHCWAWRLGHPPSERSSDAGEPSGTAGRPMLDALRGADLTDVAAVVARWFGGTKLGRGGLARAYAGAVRLALEELPVARRVPTVRFRLELPYDRVGPLQRLVHPPEVEIVATDLNQAMLDLGIERPRIGVCALNPHAGEGGLFGREDVDVIAPVVESYRVEVG